MLLFAEGVWQTTDNKDETPEVVINQIRKKNTIVKLNFQVRVKSSGEF